MPNPVQRSNDVEWRVDQALVAYPHALAVMNHRVDELLRGNAREMIWLLEHPPLYTAGTSADPAELLDPRFDVFKAGRGGRYTYHGPGQRVGYLMLDLGARGRDVRRFVHSVEGWMIETLGLVGVTAWRAPGRIGIWTRHHGQEVKIGAIGVRVRRWITLHGFSINVDPDLSHFAGIVPCGLPMFGVTSLRELGTGVDIKRLDEVLAQTFPAFLHALDPSQK